MTSEYTDTQMLDWLDGRNRALNNRYGTEYGWEVVLSPNVTRVMTKRQPADSGYVADVDVHDSRAHGHTSVRTAITEAMRSSGIHSPGVGGSGGWKEDGADGVRVDASWRCDEATAGGERCTQQCGGCARGVKGLDDAER